MTVEEMRIAIRNKCLNTINCYVEKCPLLYESNSCFEEDLTDEQIKNNYKLMFGKEESEMKNEFDFNELKAGYAIKLPSGSFCVGMQTDEDEITFFERFVDGELSAVCTKKDIINNQCRNEHEISFYPIKVYGYSENYELFDPSTRPLIWKKKEDINFKEYKFGDIKIIPNFKEGYIREDEDNEGIIYIEDSREDMNYPDNITINKSEIDGVINALIEIRDFIEED